MNSVLQASYSTLTKSKLLLSKLSDDKLCNEQIPPYYSSIGSHIRHILDFYSCIFNGLDSGIVDLTSRERDLSVEKSCDCARDYLDSILDKLESYNSSINIVKVIDDLGQGKLAIDYTIDSLFAQANSHTIHHYAIINYMLDKLGVVLEDENFGLNPTSPKKEFS